MPEEPTIPYELANPVPIEQHKTRWKAPAAIVACVLVVAMAAYFSLPYIEKLPYNQPSSQGPNVDPNVQTDFEKDQPNQFSKYYSQDATWGDCSGEFTVLGAGRAGMQCLEIKAPLNWQDSSSDIDNETQTITLRGVRTKPTTKTVKTLNINPGGPGAAATSGLADQYVDMLSDLGETYVLQAFDPRGVFLSQPIECWDNDKQKRTDLLETSQDPITETQKIVDFEKALADKCRELSGSIVDFADTQSAARDLDLIRALTSTQKDDAKKFNFFGFSYGTQLGYEYATMFPHNLGKFVLDGAVDVTVDADQDALIQAEGFETALTAYIESGSSRKDYPFKGKSTADAKQAITDFIARAKANPLKSKGTEVNDTVAFYGIAVTLYNKDYWSYLDVALSNAINSNSGDTLLYLADAYFDYDSSSAQFTNNMMDSNIVISCADSVYNDDMEFQKEHQAEIEKAAPTLGEFWGYTNLGCDPFSKAHKLETDKTASGSGQILIIGTTRDPATPLVGAQRMAAILENGVLLTNDADGHTGYDEKNPCVFQKVNSYFLNDAPLDKELSCGAGSSNSKNNNQNNGNDGKVFT